MIDLGTVKPGETIRIPFSTFKGSDGSALTMTNFVAGDILVYKDGSTTERASTSGYTATTDFDGKTGKHVAIIDLSDNTTADFYAAGSEYLVAVDAVTVDGVTTGGWIARFKIGYRTAILNTTIATLTNQTSFTLTSGPAEDNALLGWAVIHDAASAVQCSNVLIAAYTGSTKTVTLAAGASFTVAAKDNISILGHSPAIPYAPAGAANGVLISGSNSGTTTFGALTVTGATTFTGNVSAAAGVTITQSTSNGHGLSITGNGTGNGILSTSGSGATGDGIKAVSAATNGTGIEVVGMGSGHGLLATSGTTGAGVRISGTTGVNIDGSGGVGVAILGNGANAALRLTGGATGVGLSIIGGSSSGDGVSIVTTSGHGINVAPVGSSKHAILLTGGNGGTSDGLKLVAGTGGVGFRLDTLTASGALTAGSNAIPWNASWDAEVESEATDALNAYDPPTNAEMVARTLATASYATATAQTTAQNDLDIITGADGVTLATAQANYAPSQAGDAMTLTAAYDLYSADIQYTVDAANTQDELTVTWFKNGVRQTSGITVPTIQVVKRADGTDLIASTTPTQIGSTGSYKYDEATNRLTAGEAALVIVTATIDGSTRSFSRLIGRDSTA